MRRIIAAFDERSEHTDAAKPEEISRDTVPVQKLKLLIVAQTLMFISLKVCIDQGCSVVGKMVIAGGFVFSLALFIASGPDVRIAIDKCRTFYLMRKVARNMETLQPRLLKHAQSRLPVSLLSFFIPLVFMMAWVWIWQCML